MCFDDGARPPLPPITASGRRPVRGGATNHGDLVLTSTDGTPFSAYFAHPDAASSSGVVILPDVRGLHDFYRDLAVRFADAGLHAVAIDYFGRTAGTEPRPENFPSGNTLTRCSPSR